jgi:D-3-phosphoglycerate dehydrogenase / 2-oxoglutarate reductase
VSGKTVVVTDHAFEGVDQERAAVQATGAEFIVADCVDEDTTAAATCGADGVLVNFAPITRRVLEGLAPGATVVRYGVGFDNVDVAAAAELGVRVCNVPDYGADTVADHAVALLLALLRRLDQYSTAIREGGWVSAPSVGRIDGSAETTVGVLGMGRIGRSVVARLLPFGFRVIAHDPFLSEEAVQTAGASPVDLEELFRQSDALTLHLPSTPDTAGIVSAERVAAMPAGAVIVNTARGTLIDEPALVAALRSGRVGGAGLDVFAVEPLAADAPIRTTPNVILTPHAAFYSTTSLTALQRLAGEEMVRGLRSEPLRCQVA